MPMFKKILITLIVLAASGGMIFFAFRNSQRAEEASGIPKNAFPVELETAYTDTVITEIVARGSVNFISKKALYPETTAHIKSVLVKSGDVVEEGQIVILYSDNALDSLQDQLRSAKLSLQGAELGLSTAQLPASDSEIMMAESSISQAKKAINDVNDQIAQIDISLEQIDRSIDTAEKTVNDLAILYQNGVISRNELESATENVTKLREQRKSTEMQKQAAFSSLAAAEESLNLANEQYELTINRTDEAAVVNQIRQQQLSVEQSKLNIELIEKQIRDLKFEEKAPASGTIISLNVSDGSYANAGSPLMEIADTSFENLVVKINVPESDAVKLEIGQDAIISGNVVGKEECYGKVSKIYPIAEQKQIGNSLETVVQVEISITESAVDLRAGNSVEASIITRISEDAVMVPLMSTFSESGGQNFVYIMQDNYQVEKRAIELLAYSGMYVEVTGVSVGEKIITSSAPQIKEGAFVKPISTISR